MGIVALYRDANPPHLTVKVPDEQRAALVYGKPFEDYAARDWLNENAPGWRLCYLNSRPVTFQVDEFPDDDSETCILFTEAKQAALFRMFFG